MEQREVLVSCGYSMSGFQPIITDEEKLNDTFYTTFFSPPTSASPSARRYVEDRILGWWILFQNRIVNTKIKELFLERRRNESVECVFEGVPRNFEDTHDVLMVDVAGLVYITTGAMRFVFDRAKTVNVESTTSTEEANSYFVMKTRGLEQYVERMKFFLLANSRTSFIQGEGTDVGHSMVQDGINFVQLLP